MPGSGKTQSGSDKGPFTAHPCGVRTIQSYNIRLRWSLYHAQPMVMEYLLTIMCTATRFSEAVPLRNITARSMFKALLKFFTQYGISRTVQTDQGSNYMSRIFAQVTAELGTEHRCSSAYHPESQGAFERFHQTLKTMLRAYVFEHSKDRDQGVPFLLFAIRDSVQESLGLGSFELVFGHKVRGPLTLRRDRILGNANSKTNSLTYGNELESTKVYVDNVIVYSDTWESHVSAIRTLFDRLRAPVYSESG